MNNSIRGSGKNAVDMNELSISIRGTTSYANVSLMTCYSFNGEYKYVAIIGLSEEEQRISGKSTFMWHLAAFDDARHAAWAVKSFNKNRESNLIKLRQVDTCEWDCGEIPNFEYDALPDLLDKTVKTRSRVKVFKSASSQTKEITVDNRRADTYFLELSNKYNITDLARQFGREAIITARKFLTINEFQLRFGLK